MIVVEQLADAGAPQVGITVDGLSAAATLTVERSWDDGATWAAVRGAQEQVVSGSAFYRDFVPPLNVPSRYRARLSSGTITGAVEATITVPSECAWLQDPLAPRTAVPVATYADGPDQVRLMSGSAQQIQRTQPVDLVTVQGASLPVASIGTRQAPAGVPLVLRPLLDLAADQSVLLKSIRVLFDTAGQVVIRGLPAQYGLDPVAHVVAPAVTEHPSLGGVLGYHEWQLSVTQVQPSTLRVVVPWWTYADVQAIVQDARGMGATYADVAAAMPAGAVYADVLKNPHVLGGEA